MTAKHGLQVGLFLLLIIAALYRADTLFDLLSGGGLRADVRRLNQQMAELDGLEESQSALFERLDRARSELTEASASYLPDPTDPYAWATLQAGFLAGASGIQIEEIREEAGPRIRTRRGDEDRRFSVYRCRLEGLGTLAQALELVTIAETRNPYLVVSGLQVGPAKGAEQIRRVAMTLDWPAWESPAFRNELLAALDPLVDPVSDSQQPPPE